MKKYFLFLAALALAGCHTPKVIEHHDSDRDSTSSHSYTETIDVHKTDVEVPSDSAYIRALMICDDRGQVLIGCIEEISAQNSDLRFQVDSMGNLLAWFKTHPKTIPVYTTDTIRITTDSVRVTDKESNERTETITVEVEKKLTWFQRARMSLGSVFLFVILLYAVWFLFEKSGKED